ncbi:MAG: hypothetical protein KIS92_07215 [Planctomycetota bacterium]|nr:hypothetical protein [Planctomycetota bacterium]
MDARVRIDPRSALAASGAPSGKLARETPAHDPAAGLLGRSAAMLHALALFAALVAAVVAWIVGLKKDEAYTIQGVGGAAGLALALWSAGMALRALWRGEPKRWALSVALLFVLEMGALGLWQWDALTQWGGLNDAWFTWGAWIGLPAWGPALLFGTLLAAPVAMARGHAAERRARARNDETWTLARRRRSAMTFFGAVAVLAGLPVFLAALYVYSAAMHANSKFVSWQGPVVRWTPDAAKSGLNGLLDLYEGPRARNLGFSLVVGGELPSEALLSRMQDPTKAIRGYAWKVLCAQDPQRARALTLDPEAVDLVPADVQEAMAESLARDGSEAELRQAFGMLERAHVAFAEPYLKALAAEQRTAALQDLLDFAARTRRRRLFDDAGVAVEQLTSGGAWRRYWTTMLSSPHEVTRRWTAEILLKRPWTLFQNSVALDVFAANGPGYYDALVVLAKNGHADFLERTFDRRLCREEALARLAETIREGDRLDARMAARVLAALVEANLDAGPTFDACVSAYLKPFDARLELPPIGADEQSVFEELIRKGEAWTEQPNGSPRHPGPATVP